MIYFVTARELGMVKIGHAHNPQERFHTIQVSCPVPLKLERVAEGGIEIERELQASFSANRVRGEWFSITSELEQYMATLPEHQWKSRGWHHAARRDELAAAGKAA